MYKKDIETETLLYIIFKLNRKVSVLVLQNQK